MGGFRLLLSIVWAGMSLAAAFYGYQNVQNFQTHLQESLIFADASLTTIATIVDETDDVLIAIQNSLDTAHQTTVDTSLTLTDTRPLVDQVAQVITQDIPVALDGVQASMPSVIETAAAVDETLIFLSAFQFSIPNPFGNAWTIGLGIDYAPEVPLDTALEALSSNLEGIPDELYSLEDDFDNTSLNLLTLRDDLSGLADDIYQINQQLAELNPAVEALANHIQNLQQNLDAVQDGITGRVQTIWLWYLGILGLIFLSQFSAGYQALRMMNEKERK